VLAADDPQRSVGIVHQPANLDTGAPPFGQPGGELGKQIHVSLISAGAMRSLPTET